MANVSKTIEIIFAGTDKLSGVIKNVGDEVSDFGDSITNIGQPFADAAKTVALLDAAIVGLGVAGLKASADLDKESQKMANSLGLPAKEAEKFSAIAKEVYSAGFGEDLSKAFEAVTVAQKKFADNAEVDIGKVTTQALKLQETFGTEYADSLGAVNSLMTNFGITSEEAFNFITAGFQKGLDGSGDFLDSITEYGTQFKSSGATAGQFFSIMETGYAEGIAGTDKAADAFKEFRVRIQDGSKGVADALKSIGIDNAELQSNLNTGKTSIAEAFQLINQAIQKTDDQGVAFRAGVGLMGTQFEDLGTKAALSLDLTKTKIEDLNGTIGNVDTASMGRSFESLYRTIITGIADNESWDAAKAKLSDIFGDMTESFKAAFQNIDLKALENKIGEIWTGIADIFKEADLDLTTVEGMQHAMDMVTESIESLADITKGLIDIFKPIVTTAVDLVDKFNDLDTGTKQLIGQILGLGTALTVVGGIVSTGGSLVSGFGSVAKLLSKGGAFASSIASTTASLVGATGLQGALATLAGPAGLVAIAAGAGVAAGSLARLIPGVDEAAQGFAKWTDEIFNWSGAQEVVSKETLAADIALIKLNKSLNVNSEEFQKNTTDGEEFNRMLKEIDDIPTIDLTVNTDSASIQTAQNEIDGNIPDEIVIDLGVDGRTLQESKDKIEEAIPPLKRLEIETNLQVETLKAQAATIQTAIEWKAQLDIAEVEANARKVEAIVESVGKSAESAGNVLSSIFSGLNGGDTSFAMDRIIDEQIDIQKEALEIQSELAKAEIDYLNTKREQIATGTSLITVEAAGLTPALEMIWQQIIEYSQVRANEEGLSLLL